MHLHAALITTLNVLLLVLATVLSGRARGRYNIKAPATTGHPDFERAFRAHQNTLEQSVLFLPLLWIASLYGNEQYAVWLGYAWLVGRVWYLFAYISATGNRSAGFGIAGAASIALLLVSFIGLVPRLLA